MTSDGEVIDELGDSPAEPANNVSADPCGCAPWQATTSDPRGTHETAPETHEAHHERAAGVQTPPRELKLVVLLRPTGAGFQACMAAGSEGCDPELRVADMPDLPTALAALFELAAAAEARWRKLLARPARSQVARRA